MTGTPPVAERPGLADDYAIEPGEDGLLPWSSAEQRLVPSPNEATCAQRVAAPGRSR